MKNFWFVQTFQIQNGKLYAASTSFNTNQNLAWAFDPAYGCVTANICETKKQAEAIATMWNETYKRNGTYAF